MTDPQIFAFLVMPFLFVLTCSMVFFSSQSTRSQKPADPVTKPNTYTRKPAKNERQPRELMWQRISTPLAAVSRVPLLPHSAASR